MSSLHPYQNMYRPRGMQYPIDSTGASPVVVRFIEDKIMKRVVSVERCLDADGFRFVFEDGDVIVVPSIHIEHIERESGGRRLMGRSEFEDIVLGSRLSREESAPKLRAENHPSVMHCEDDNDGTIQGMEPEKIIVDDLYEESSPMNKFYNSLRKVYWYRRSKKINLKLWQTK